VPIGPKKTISVCKKTEELDVDIQHFEKAAKNSSSEKSSRLKNF
jgi:hypothetical protein